MCKLSLDKVIIEIINFILFIFLKGFYKINSFIDTVIRGAVKKILIERRRKRIIIVDIKIAKIIIIIVIER